MELQDQKTGIFGVSRTWDVSHEVDGEAEQCFREDVVCRMMAQGLTEILKDGRRYEVMLTVSTVSGGTYPPGIPADGAPCLGRPQGTSLSMIYTQYTTSCRLVVVLVDPMDAEIGEYVQLGALHYAGEHDYHYTMFCPDGDRKFERSTVGWKRTG